MKIIYKNGDFLTGPEKIVAHGCNASNGFGSGCAAAIAKKYPEAKQAYHNYFKEFGLKLGEIIPVECNDGKIICHCITQEFYGKDGKKYVSYEAIRDSMRKLNNAISRLLEAFPDDSNTVALPKIGSGLAGGDWAIIEKIIEEESTAFQPVIYIL